ncbi:phytanoyl-CoA dioxygenase family protein [Caulobacter sp. DWR2-3-1b2]|uniref:phytanoyl-CoA dioxygenase family protein n=1 Tax=unclassified Caulobacter TaxID=2648921 RepID=UPI003CF3AF29
MRAVLQRDGAVLAPAILDSIHIAALRDLAVAQVGKRPGARLHGAEILETVLSPTGPVGALAAELTTATARPVRAVMFDKTPEANWSVGWHQDRTIPVRRRVEIEGFGPWSTKDGLLHVAPPFEILQRMVTLRIHLDPVTPDNAPLRAALGSHRLGRVSADQAAIRAIEHVVVACLAEVGDIWAYATPILHASDRSKAPRRRRVLQVDYADFSLPGGLEWLGLAA